MLSFSRSDESKVIDNILKSGKKTIDFYTVIKFIMLILSEAMKEILP